MLVNLAKLGADFPLAGIGLVGEDDDGRGILSDCDAFGIDAAQMHTTNKAGTSYTDVMTAQSTARRTFFHLRGASSQLNEAHFDLAASNARIFHLGYVLLLDELDRIAEDGTTGAARLLRQGRELGFKTSLDVVSENSDRFRTIVAPALPCVDYLIVNEFEASKCAGVEIEIDGQISFTRASEAAQRLLEAGVHEWVIIHCPEGALARNNSGDEAFQSSVRVPSEQIAGTAGAGDAFAAGALLGLHDDWGIQKCLQMAVCSAASSLSGATCTEAVKPAAECLALGDELGFRGIHG